MDITYGFDPMCAVQDMSRLRSSIGLRGLGVRSRELLLHLAVGRLWLCGRGTHDEVCMQV